MSDAVLSWIAENAVPIATSGNLDDLDDLRPMAAIAQEASVVALGVSSRLTHELSTVASRIVRRLIREDGFRSLALEGDEVASAALDEHVRTGEGDLEALLGGARPFWRTAEILDTVRWVRERNRAHPDDPVRIVHPPREGVVTRDLTDAAEIERALAGNVLDWLYRSGHRIVYWGGVAHTAVRDGPAAGHRTMGARLRHQIGRRYVSVGLTFHHNTAAELGPAPAADLAEATLGSPRIGAGAYLLDLGAAPRTGPVRDWLDAPTRFRLIGPRYDPDLYLDGGSLTGWFDAVVQVTETTPAHLLTTG